jgi:hypothetical protein
MEELTLPIVKFDFLLDCLPIKVKSLHESISLNGIACQLFHDLSFISRLLFDDALLVIFQVPDQKKKIINNLKESTVFRNFEYSLANDHQFGFGFGRKFSKDVDYLLFQTEDV